MKKGPFIAGLLFFLVLGSFFGPRLLQGKTIDVTHPIHGPAVEGVYATGTVEATVMMPIAPRTGARLMELKVDEGSTVKKGQVLAQMEDTDLRHSQQELQTREDLAKREFDRSSKLYKARALSKDAYDRAQADWEAAIAATHASTAQVSYMKLLAPANGTIIRRDGEVGQLIPANQAVFWLSCCAPLRISAEVDEEDISQVQPDQQVLIRADAFPDGIFHGTVQSITPMGDATARSYRVRIGFTEEVPLKIGMTTETNIIVRETKDALLVPAGAVAQNKLWIVEGGVLKRIPVTTGAKDTRQIEITKGIADGATIVASPDSTLKEGARPRLRLVEQPPRKAD